MSLVQLSKRDLVVLEQMSLRGADARQVRRAEALLWLHEGYTPSEVAEQLRVSVQTVYNWVNRFSERDGKPLGSRLGDGHRDGRPPSAQGIIDPLIAQVIDSSPEQYGYQASVWTAPLLRSYLARDHTIRTSRASVSRAIKRLRIRWKRPRHILARRAAHWRQSKGGSNAA
jgi:transposase